MVSVDIVPCILRTSNIQSDMCHHVSVIITDLVSFCVVALRVSAACYILSPDILLRYSDVVLEYLFSDRSICGTLTYFMVSTCSSAKNKCCVVFPFEIISTTIRAAVLSALYFLSLLLADSDISRLLSLFKFNIADTCVVVTDTPGTTILWKFSMPAWTTISLL